MKRPDILNQLVDQKNGVTYKILAYRSLTKNEILFCIAKYRSQKRNKALKKGSEIIIETIIGHNDLACL